ncbi:hypothetical protein FRAHR75_180027 [Frankia sp. Hr75.2]|nr:hypothetical protein FRAHR75_180027 [Frankia sp. Hr75.2]
MAQRFEGALGTFTLDLPQLVPSDAPMRGSRVGRWRLRFPTAPGLVGGGRGEPAWLDRELALVGRLRQWWTADHVTGLDADDPIRRLSGRPDGSLQAGPFG